MEELPKVGKADRRVIAEQLGILEHLDAGAHEVQNVVVRVKAVGFAPGDLHRSHIADGVFLAPRLDRATLAESVVRGRQALHQVLGVVEPRMGHRERDVDQLPPRRRVPADDVLQLQGAPFHQPRRAHGAGPNALARFEATIVRALALALMPDFDAASHMDAGIRHALPRHGRNQPAMATLERVATRGRPDPGLRLHGEAQ
ncbi:hypothetical protein D3C84_843940 [compost metagenome]